MQIFSAPIPPNYDKIINDELIKIREYSFIPDKRTRNKLEKNNPLYNNPAHNNAEIEAFEAAVNSRLLIEKEKYYLELDEYKKFLLEKKEELNKEINNIDIEIEEKRQDFNLAKGFYDNFQSLVNSKFAFINKAVKELFSSKNSDDVTNKES